MGALFSIILSLLGTALRSLVGRWMKKTPEEHVIEVKDEQLQEAAKPAPSRDNVIDWLHKDAE